jgi:PAS domain S-box-containing protein
MESPDETLGRISRRGGAVFAMDASNRIIHWNAACEKLLGLPARAVLGKPCHQVLDGRDANGNDYCQLRCPVAHQARTTKEHPVCQFELNVRTGDGGRRIISTGLFAIESYHPALATLVHVCRETPPPIAAKRDSKRRAEPSLTVDGAETLTNREAEVLQLLGKGLAAGAIGAALFISQVTVRNHVSRILAKLHVHTRLAAVVFAYRHHLI